MSGNEYEAFDVSALPPAPAEFDFLPDLEERRRTLMRANAALERARILLARVRELDPRTDPERAERPAAEGAGPSAGD